MTANDQQRLGKTLWNIADQLRGAMNADDFRDYMLAFLFLRYLSDNYETAAKKELGCRPLRVTWWGSAESTERWSIAPASLMRRRMKPCGGVLVPQWNSPLPSAISD